MVFSGFDQFFDFQVKIESMEMLCEYYDIGVIGVVVL